MLEGPGEGHSPQQRPGGAPHSEPGQPSGALGGRSLAEALHLGSQDRGRVQTGVGGGLGRSGGAVGGGRQQQGDERAVRWIIF